MKRFMVLGVLFISFLRVEGQVIFPKPLSARQTGYAINAVLDPGNKVVNGEMKAFWVNLSPENVSEVQIHLYLNAFRDRNSTFAKESGGEVTTGKDDAGQIDITSLSFRGADLMPSMRFISPDDGNPYDRTVASIQLPQPCRPGDSVILDVSFRSKLPGRIIRTGASGDFFFVAQWFPKFGVYETAGMRYALKGGWNCHQFHRNSEFYSNHSVYDVNITVPEDYVVGSCGLLVSEKKLDDGKKTLAYRAEDIVDFAWTAWPGYAVYNDQWKHVKIMLLVPPERKSQVERQFTALKNALEYFEEHAGPYPWPYVTIVDPPMQGARAGGMEYTTLFTSQSFYGVPEFFKMPELVTIHEFGHAYFMGILGSNEFEEPWLDEGVNSFFEVRIVDHYYGANSGFLDLPHLKISDKSFSRMQYTASPARQAVSNSEYSWNYPHGTYSMMSYQKTSVILQTLMGIIGEEKTDMIFREYYKRWAFRHPSGKDFIRTANDVMIASGGSSLDWFFSQTLYGTGICDYKVAGILNRSLRPGTNDSVPENQTSDSLFKAVAQLERIGDLVFPVDVQIHFDNGEEILEKWDGQSRWKDFIYSGSRKIEWVKIDPGFKIKMDVNYNNNSETLNPDRIPIKRMRNTIIVFLQFLISIISL